MKRYLPFLALALLAAITLPQSALGGGTGYPGYRGGSCAVSKFQTPRYNQTLPYRHFEDHRRYNAAPCCNEVVPQAPYLLKTVVVRKKRVPHYTYDSNGRRHCHKVLTTTYKDIYSNGGCRVYTVTE